MAPSYRDIHEKLKREIPSLAPSEVAARQGRGKPPVLIDVRESHELAVGAIPGSTHVPRGFLEARIESVAPDKTTQIVAYCESGVRSLFAADTLLRLGYSDVASMEGGFEQWKSEGFPVAVAGGLSESDRRRYDRHIRIPEVGVEGQTKLLNARVLLVGAGGLGSPAGYYLAAAGIGTLGIVDFDVVDETNLQRQILHFADRVGMPKTESARRSLAAINPGIKIVPIEARLSSKNVESIFENYDIIVDGSDNFPTRYLVNDACVLMKKPNIHGSVYRFEGQVSVFHPPDGPCYRCLFPEPPSPRLAPSCAEAGVLGVLPGVIGLLEAVEVIKWVLGRGKSLVGRLVHYDALSTEFRELKIPRNPDCKICADGIEFPGFVDYERFCGSG